MTEALHIGGITIAGTVQLRGELAAGPPITIGGATTLDSLADVQGATDAAANALLIKDSDGQWRPGPPPPVAPRWWHGNGPPPQIIPGAAPGDIYVDDTGPAIYTLV